MTGQSISPFELPGTNNIVFKSTDCRGKVVGLYFYPKDNTPGCTAEGEEFRDLHPEFAHVGCVIVGVSRDSLRSHEGFKSKMNFPFELLSDADEKACKLFGVIKMKNMYGRQVRGIERSTFVIDAEGVLRREWRGVKVPGHAKEVLTYVNTLQP